MSRKPTNSPPRNATHSPTTPTHSSSMQSPTHKPQSKIQSPFLHSPNELRLKELMDLQTRSLPGPGPGSHSPRIVDKKTSKRRAHDPSLDGPFLPNPSSDFKAQTTREKEIEHTMRQGQPDSGISPGQYNSGEVKEQLLRSSPKIKIGSSSREGKSQHAKALSISRSIQHGIDYHATVILVPAGKLFQPTSRRNVDAGDHHQAPPPENTFESSHLFPSPPGTLPLSKAPPAPAAVARGIKKEFESSPGEWDWQKLGHNYRANFSTQGGGAYSKGDRSTSRRDLRGAVDSLDLLPKMAIEPSDLPLPTRDTLAGPQGDANVLRDERYGTMEPRIGLDSRGGLGPLGEQGDFSSMPPTPAVPNLDITYNSSDRGNRADQLLSGSELRRREEAARAAFAIAMIHERRAAWDQKKSQLM